MADILVASVEVPAKSLDLITLRKMGDIVLKHIRKEAQKDFIRRGADPRAGVPSGTTFFDSFYDKPDLPNTIEIYSSWPYISKIIEGVAPHPMTWLTQEKGVKVIPLVAKTGEVQFRTVPMKTQNAWIHPGIAKHTFIQRAVENSIQEMIPLILDLELDQFIKNLPEKI